MAHDDQPNIRELARDRKLAAENAKWRTQVRALEARIKELEAGASSSGSSSPAPVPDAPTASADASSVVPSGEDGSADVSADNSATPTDDPELANVYADLRDQYVLQRLQDAGALHPADARDLLLARGQMVIGDDDEPAVIIDGKPHALESRSLEKVLNPALIRASGVGGAGSRRPYSAPATTNGGFDSGRYIRDAKYRAEVKRQRQSR